MERADSKIDLRPRSRDIMRVRSEDLTFDPLKDRQQLQKLKREKFVEQQIQLQEHQRQWRIQQRKQKRRLQRRERIAERERSQSKPGDDGSKCQQKRQEDWKSVKGDKVCDPEEVSKDILGNQLAAMVEAPLEAHFLKGLDRKKSGKEDANDSCNDTSSASDWDEFYVVANSHYIERRLMEADQRKAPSFSSSSRHREHCARCHIFHHYYHHGHNLATVHPGPALDNASFRRPPTCDARSFSVVSCSPCPHYASVSDRLSQQLLHSPLLSPQVNVTSSRDESLSSPQLRKPSPEKCNVSLQHKSPTSSGALPIRKWQSQDDRHFLRSQDQLSRGSSSRVQPGTATRMSLQVNNHCLESSDDDSELYEDIYDPDNTGVAGNGDYYILVVVDDFDDSTDAGTHSDDALVGTSSDREDDSLDLEGWDSDPLGMDNPFMPPYAPPEDVLFEKLKETVAPVAAQNSDADRRFSQPGTTGGKTLLHRKSTLFSRKQSEEPCESTHTINNNVVRRTSYIVTDNSNKESDNRRVSDDSRMVNYEASRNKIFVRGHGTHHNDPSRKVSGELPCAVLDVACKATGSRAETDSSGRTRIMQGINGSEARRRNFSSSSLPLSLMTATIEEVDDAEYLGTSPNSHRPHSYSGGVTPSPKVPLRTLRREPRVQSMNSPPRARRHGPCLRLMRSASDNTNKSTGLRDVDIVGESFQSRFPWQRDVGVQCHLTVDHPLHPNLQRVVSGPSSYTFYRSLSMPAHNTLPSPPVTTARRSTHHYCCRSYSHSDLDSLHPMNSSGEPAAHARQATARHRSNASIAESVEHDSVSVGHPYGSRSADFRRKSRLAPFGVVENSRPWDFSRQTSVSSLDFEDDILRYLEASDNRDSFIECSDECLMRDDVLPSPPTSPRMWVTVDEEEDVDYSDESVNVSVDQIFNLPQHMRRYKQPRRLSSGSITSDAESDGNEPDPPVARRGRRAAIYETKNCGDVSPTTLSPDISPSNSCDEGEGASNIAERLRRRRSSVDLAMNIYPGDLLVQEHHRKLIKRNTIADFYAAGRTPNGGPLPPGVAPGSVDGVDANKKGRQPFSLLKLMKTRSKESLTKLDEILKRIKPSEFKDNHLAAYKSLHWSDLIASSDKLPGNQTGNLSDTERKRREAVWELFKSECVFLIDHLMVLKHCFMEPMKKVQVEGSLMYAEPQDLFGNLDELSYVSYTFCKDFIADLLKDLSITDFGRTNVLLEAFQRFSAHSRDGAVYHSYCLNYTNALTYLDKLRANPEFAEFEKWCEQDPRCNRLQLTDLLVAPMQHCTKLPLLLHNVRKYTADEDERQQVAESIEKVETSLKKLEEKMRWIKNFERVQEIQRQIVWPTVTELDPRCVIPESLKPTLNKQPCEKLLACPKRQLLHEGQITLVETPKPLDVHMFLFDDILLICKFKKVPRKSKQTNSDAQSSGQSDRISYTVFRQPLALDRFTLHDISTSDAAASGLKHCFALVHVSRYQQITGVFTFQAACDTTKGTWLTQIREAMDSYAKAASSRNNSFKGEKEPKIEDKEPVRPVQRGEFCIFSPRRFPNGHSNSLRGVPTKSRSMDAVFI